MARGRLYEEDYQLRLSGHETFPLRYGWLKKAFDAVAEQESRGCRTVGVPCRRLDRPIRCWTEHGRVYAPLGGGRWSYLPTDGCKTTLLGRFLFDAGGLDPYMEDPVTAWLVHWMLSGNPRNTTWFWAFNHYAALTFRSRCARPGYREVGQRASGNSSRRPSTIQKRCCLFRANLCGAAAVCQRRAMRNLWSPPLRNSG